MSRPLSDPYLIAAFWTGVAAFLLTLTLVGVIVFLRVRLRLRERRWDRFVAVWRPALLAAILDPGSAPPLPDLRPGESVLFLRLWAYLQESLRGDAARLLNETALRLRIDETARALLVRGSRTERLQAVLAAGYLRDAQAWEALVATARSSDSLLSVNAARALVRINPLRAANGLLPLVVTRADWDIGRVAGFLAEARQAFWLLMAKTIPLLQLQELQRALLLAEALRIQLPEATLARLLQPEQPTGVLQAALRLSDSPGLAEQVLRFLSHPEAAVREQAVLQMGRLSTPSDLPALTGMLDDPAWPVRMAAARALASLPFLGSSALEALEQDHPQAVDMLRQVRAERGLG
ncbi:HEAT repeat domain-containing protein [Ramlibacter pallidus]|uniref:HEAT repeat domain-containing protein n=1 Tax=Ramlibacter pallidus TaxID=2780087 RepID=A0ABR9S387_9BURK|nr:HEAT repeat domain-containing protein [Ramlibacter pallidus]